MASTTHVTAIDANADATGYAEQRLRRLEERWSRFIETSDISRINQHTGQWVFVSIDTVRLIETMQLASRATGGGFDPTHLYQLLSMGYRSSIDDPERCTLTIDAPDPVLTVHDIEIDRSACAVRVPCGLSLDPGGIGKGLAADLVVTELLEQGTAGALVSIGGDIAAAGTAPTEHGWIIDIDDPDRSGTPVATLSVSAGGIATSSTRSRRWSNCGTVHHHQIDPATGRESHTDLASITVVANAGWLAEAHATAALLLGSRSAISHLDAYDLAGMAINDHGVVLASRSLDPMSNEGHRS